jgi:hypothetical protein
MSVPRSEWLSPGAVLGAIGMLAAIGGAWMMFESRITAVEQQSQFTTTRLDRIETKLDRLIEQGVKH